MSEPLKIVDLPNEVLEKILSFLSFDEIAKNREVSKKFNTTCGRLLNRGFLQMEKKHSAILKKVKSLLPRRESERRVHHLARHCDILSAIETRINMLDMTFLKYIDVGACCFIPGKVIDEILRILKMVENTDAPPRTHEVLQELRDISSMAMEYFDEKIAPGLQHRRSCSVPPFELPGPSSAYHTLPRIVVRDTFRKEFNTIQHRTNRHGQVINVLKSLVTKLTLKIKKQNRQITSQATKIREQNAKIHEQDASIAELKKHVEEWDLKFTELTTGLIRSREDLSQNSSKSNTPTQPIPHPHTVQSAPIRTTSYSPPRYRSNIRPRMAQVSPRSVIINQFLDENRKRKAENLLRNPAAPVPAKISRIQPLKNEDEVRIRSPTESMLDKLPLFLSSSLESLIKSPINSLRSRKRKL